MAEISTSNTNNNASVPSSTPSASHHDSSTPQEHSDDFYKDVPDDILMQFLHANEKMQSSKATEENRENSNAQSSDGTFNRQANRGGEREGGASQGPDLTASTAAWLQNNLRSTNALKLSVNNLKDSKHWPLFEEFSDNIPFSPMNLSLSGIIVAPQTPQPHPQTGQHGHSQTAAPTHTGSQSSTSQGQISPQLQPPGPPTFSAPTSNMNTLAAASTQPMNQNNSNSVSGAASTGTSTSQPSPPLQMPNSAQNKKSPTSNLPVAPTRTVPKITTQQTARAKLVVDFITQLQNSKDQKVEQLRQVQQQMFSSLPISKELYQQQQVEYLKLTQQIDYEQKQLHQLNRLVILDPYDLYQARVLSLRLTTQQHKVELLRRELQEGMANSSVQRCIAALVIKDQPISQVLFKTKAMEDTFIVQLITGTLDINHFSKVRAILISEEQNWKTPTPIENETAVMDAFQKTAIFHNIKINISTRMSLVQLKFQMNFATQANAPYQLLESSISYPMIVITNESQWSEAAGRLLFLDWFSSQQPEVPWPLFANTLHHHFLKATRQDPSRPSRHLNKSDFDYLHSTFLSMQPNISQQQATSFWNWFGQVVQTIRFKRHINNLWFTGLIYGLLSKRDATLLLQNQDVGTFLIRFSETNPGLFSVSFVSNDDPPERVKHYLIRHEEISSNKTLPDFLKEKPQLMYVLQIDLPGGVFRKIPKELALHNFFSKGKRSQYGANGYIDTL